MSLCSCQRGWSGSKTSIDGREEEMMTVGLTLSDGSIVGSTFGY